ncbi:hypothetical protein LTR50_004778 [Elasticomyces elasticus]|nr:hypothetical protein LTR50_004778 [Elasticomyces elasticus]
MASNQDSASHSMPHDDATAEHRVSIKRILRKLHDELQTQTGHPARVTCTLNFHIDSDPPTVRTYKTTLGGAPPDLATQNVIDLSEAENTSPWEEAAAAATAAAAVAVAAVNGHPAGEALREDRFIAGEQSSAEPESRPSKRRRTGSNEHDRDSPSRSATATGVATRPAPEFSERALTWQHMRPGADTKEILDFLRVWREQWREQGGWLYDNFKQSFEEDQRRKTWTDEKLDALQKAVVAVSQSTHNQIKSELTNILELLPWLEHCRKTGTDAQQLREERWRTSSATFHDSNRRDRATAEKVMMGELKTQTAMLQEQQSLLKRLMEDCGLDIGDAEGEPAPSNQEQPVAARVKVEPGTSSTTRRWQCSSKPPRENHG